MISPIIAGRESTSMLKHAGSVHDSKQNRIDGDR
jgi:hypothetical protein